MRARYGKEKKTMRCCKILSYILNFFKTENLLHMTTGGHSPLRLSSKLLLSLLVSANDTQSIPLFFTQVHSRSDRLWQHAHVTTLIIHTIMLILIFKFNHHICCWTVCFEKARKRRRKQQSHCTLSWLTPYQGWQMGIEMQSQVTFFYNVFLFYTLLMIIYRQTTNVSNNNKLLPPLTPGTSLFTGTTNNDNDNVRPPPGMTGTTNGARGGSRCRSVLSPGMLFFYTFFYSTNHYLLLLWIKQHTATRNDRDNKRSPRRICVSSPPRYVFLLPFYYSTYHFFTE